jgi:hypothetical protein
MWMLAIILWQFKYSDFAVGASFTGLPKVLKGSNPIIACIFYFVSNTGILSMGRREEALRKEILLLLGTLFQVL